MRSLWGDLAPILGILLIIVLLLSIVVVLDQIKCATKADMLQVEHYYRIFSLVNCRVKVNNTWIPIENYLVK